MVVLAQFIHVLEVLGVAQYFLRSLQEVLQSLAVPFGVGDQEVGLEESQGLFELLNGWVVTKALLERLALISSVLDVGLGYLAALLELIFDQFLKLLYHLG